jgi:hypothetical protein
MAEPASTFTSDLAVVYLARFAEGPKPIANFVESYNRHEAGIVHDRVVIRKGFSEQNTAQDEILISLFPNVISVSDDGFDITAFASAAAQLSHKHVVFLNTFSEIVSDRWLAKLRSGLSDIGTGLAGATGSYESLHSSMKQYNRGLFNTRFLPSPGGMRRLSRVVRKLVPRRLVDQLVAAAVAYSARSTHAEKQGVSNDEFEAFWERETRQGGLFDYLHAIPLYPNAHVRTNAFIIERQTFLETLPTSLATKQEAYLYESGPDSLTQKVLRRGEPVRIVGCNGQSYDIDQWPKSGTFRLGEQHNLLVQDNQTRLFQSLNEAEKRAFVEMTWGSSLI